MWRNDIFSDESRFILRKSDGRVKVWRRPGERHADSCIDRVTALGGVSSVCRHFGVFPPNFDRKMTLY